ncbi:MAG TPA: hypothetical protein VL371_01045 [Gemmataceae bacterium]|nr:hypothetical protein [Gemmataceae bacterium]
MTSTPLYYASPSTPAPRRNRYKILKNMGEARGMVRANFWPDRGYS